MTMPEAIERAAYYLSAAIMLLGLMWYLKTSETKDD